MHEIIEQHEIAPEDLAVLNSYLVCTNIEQTMRDTGLSKEQVVSIINKKEIRKVIDAVFLEQGYMNRFRLRDILDTIIDQKLREAEESEMYTNKDLLDVLAFAHKISVDERKLQNDREKVNKPTNQTNVQINEYGENYGNLLERILDGNK